jgi:hypothetical protein
MVELRVSTLIVRNQLALERLVAAHVRGRSDARQMYEPFVFRLLSLSE